MSARFERLARWYTASAIVLLNTLLAFVLINAFVFVASRGIAYLRNWEHSGHTCPVCPLYGDSLRDLYPGRSEGEIDAILDESWSRPVVYEPYTHFTERPIQGRFVNVDRQGFRHTTNQGPWPPESRYFNVFMFGGSTVFNYGAADEETIASFLQGQMKEREGRSVRVYNFGRGAYYSTQERILFEKLIVSGFRPDLAIFLDGLNDFSFFALADTPMFNDWFQELFNDRSVAKPAAIPLERLPVYQALRWVKGQAASALAERQPLDAHDPKYSDPKIIGSVISRYRDNKTIIETVAASHSVRTLFVWQPIPTYKWDLKYHLCPDRDVLVYRFGYTRAGFELMALHHAQQSLGDNFRWCADIQQGLDKPLYVDDVHYSAQMSRLVASCIAGAFDHQPAAEVTGNN